MTDISFLIQIDFHNMYVDLIIWNFILMKNFKSNC